MRQTLLLLFLFLLLLSGECLAQKYPILHYTTREGLSQMQVTTTFRDSRGYLWIGTKYGFCKFNGERFERFVPDFKMVGEEVKEFVEDRKGYIYVLSLSSFLSRFDGQKFVEIKKPK
jgi:ligand-binding sensor domain-containing protein